MVTGSTIIPASLRFTRSTSSACVSMVRFLWMTPTPPAWAMAMASRDSVTVSMAAEMTGCSSRCLGTEGCAGPRRWGGPRTIPGMIRTSSKVRAISGTGSCWLIWRSNPEVYGRVAGRMVDHHAQAYGRGRMTRPCASLYQECFQPVARSLARQHFLYFLPEPQGQGSLRPTFSPCRVTVLLLSWG